MFKKLKQRIEEGDSPSATSTPKSPVPGRSVRVNGELRRENKWERRRQSSASLYSSRDSLVSVDSNATVSRASPSGGFFSTPVGTPVETPAILSALRDGGTKDDVIAELAKRTAHIKKLEGKITDMASAFAEQSRQKERLEEALQELRSDVQQKVEEADRRYNGKLKGLEDQYRKKLTDRDEELKDLLSRKDQETNKMSDMEDLNNLQREEISRMRGMQLESIDRQYAEQKNELQELQSRLDELAKDRSKFEGREKQFSIQISNLEKEKSALKSQLNETINELSEAASELGATRLSLSRVQDELASLRQTYTLFKTKASEENDRKEHEKLLMRERISDLEQRLEDSKLSENDQIRAIEKERTLMEKRLQEAREQLGELRSHTNDKVNTLGSLVSNLDERLKEKEDELRKLKETSGRREAELSTQIKSMEEKLSASRKTAETSRNLESSKVDQLEEKIQEQDQKITKLKQEKAELEETIDKMSLMEAQKKHIESRLKESTSKFEEERNKAEEKIRELQSEARRSSYRQEHTNRLKIESLESKIEEQERRITQYQQRLEDVSEEKDQIQEELSMKDEECKQASLCLEDAMKRTNELKGEIASLEESLRERDDLIMCIKETGDSKPSGTSAVRSPNLEVVLQEELRQLRETFHEREQALIDREEEISQLRHILNEREGEISTYLARIKEFEENNRGVPSGRFKTANDTRDLQKTVARLSGKVQDLETQLREKENMIASMEKTKSAGSPNGNEILVANRALEAELDEANKKLKLQQQKFFELKKACQKELKLNLESDTTAPQVPKDFTSSPNSPFKNEQEKRDYLEVNFKYLKHVILKYMCSTNDQSRQLVGVISHLLQFSSREEAIVKQCIEWKLPLK